MKLFRNINFELPVWILILIYLALINPDAKHFSFCLLNILGFDWCPGCGLGHSMSYALHGRLYSSWQAHYLGVPAMLVLVWHVAKLFRFELKKWRFEKNTG